MTRGQEGVPHLCLLLWEVCAPSQKSKSLDFAKNVARERVFAGQKLERGRRNAPLFVVP